ncbi:hypothetical protein WK37_21565 [Burkholderia ubonensis]|nr:hypothetical protein WK37_21565 [Burkholderia ubonensis]KVT24900.1 hypothetical protein WK49_12675 [Burkholderia ubonensis]
MPAYRHLHDFVSSREAPSMVCMVWSPNRKIEQRWLGLKYGMKRRDFAENGSIPDKVRLHVPIE